MPFKFEVPLEKSMLAFTARPRTALVREIRDGFILYSIISLKPFKTFKLPFPFLYSNQHVFSPLIILQPTAVMFVKWSRYSSQYTTMKGKEESKMAPYLCVTFSQLQL